MSNFFQRAAVARKEAEAEERARILPKTRATSLLYLLVGGGLATAAILWLAYVGKPEIDVPSNPHHRTLEHERQLKAAAVPSVVLLFGVVIGYLGLVKLAFGAATARIGTKQVNGATLLFAVGLLATMGVVGYIVIGRYNIRI